MAESLDMKYLLTPNQNQNSLEPNAVNIACGINDC